MNLYQICLPSMTNDRSSLYTEELEHWEMKAIILAGGYTFLGPREGAWRDPSTRKVYKEIMHWYEVACDEAQVWKLVSAALELFPDQLSIFMAKVGEARIVERPVSAERELIEA